MPEITTITSEALQAEVRRLLPSQRGFGGDLEASNVIQPIVDLTPTADGSSLRADLQSAVSFGRIIEGQRRTAGTSNILSTPGFYKYNFVLSVLSANVAFTNSAVIHINDGSTNKIVHRIQNNSNTTPEPPQTIFGEGVLFLQTGDAVELVVDGNDGYVAFTGWQIADVYGNFVNPDGFTFE